MRRYFTLILFGLCLVACSTKDENYYATHPEDLQKAIALCPKVQPDKVTCEQLKMVAYKVNALIFDLQINPQEFGKKILALQLNLAKDTKSEGRKKIQLELNMHLALVKWLESPEK